MIQWVKCHHMQPGGDVLNSSCMHMTRQSPNAIWAEPVCHLIICWMEIIRTAAADKPRSMNKYLGGGESAYRFNKEIILLAWIFLSATFIKHRSNYAISDTERAWCWRNHPSCMFCSVELVKQIRWKGGQERMNPTIHGGGEKAVLHCLLQFLTTMTKSWKHETILSSSK